MAALRERVTHAAHMADTQSVCEYKVANVSNIRVPDLVQDAYHISASAPALVVQAVPAMLVDGYHRRPAGVLLPDKYVAKECCDSSLTLTVSSESLTMLQTTATIAVAGKFSHSPH